MLHNKSKPLGLLAFGLLLTGMVSGQQNTVSTGGNASGTGGTVSYTVGQIDYLSFSGSNGTVSQGVQQPYEIYAASVNELFAEVEMNLFPNPSASLINLMIGLSPEENQLSYTLTDLNGKLLLDAAINSKNTQINIQDLPVSNYFLTVLVNGTSAKTFKLIKN